MAAEPDDGAETVAEPADVWHGVVISEGLRDPTLINDLRVVGARISTDDQPVDDHGTLGRWHLYWVDVTPTQIDLLQSGTLHEWYAHFWRGSRLLVVYDDTRFELVRDDRATWTPAIEHGLQQGLRPEWLDFSTDGSTRELAQPRPY